MEREPRTGDIVLVKEEKMPRSNDNNVRSATVRLPSSKTLRRPLILLYPMELNINNGKTNDKNEDSANNGSADGGSVHNDTANDNGAADDDQQLVNNGDGGTVHGGTEVKARGKRQAAQRSTEQLRQLIVSDSV